MKWLLDVYRGEFFDFKNKMSSRLPLALYAGLRLAELPGPWHYKGYFTPDNPTHVGLALFAVVYFTHMYCMFCTRIARRERNCHNSSEAWCNYNVARFLLQEILYCNPRQWQNTKYIEIKHFFVHFEIDVFPVCSLRTASIIHQDVQLKWGKRNATILKI